MTVSISQYVDLLVKKLYGVAKTDTAANKSPSNESIASPMLNRGDTCWTQSNLIPPIAAATSGLVEAYLGVDAVQCTADSTTVPIGGVYPSWLTNLSGWIPQEFGATYFIKAYVDNPGAANPQLTGTQIFDSGSSGIGEWFFDYQAGLLNFIGQTIPAVLTSAKVIYIVGYRYVGLIGVQNLGNVDVGNIFTDGYYYANGTPVSFGGGNVSTSIVNGNSTVSIPVANADINVTVAGNQTWNFNTARTLTCPDTSIISMSGSNSQIITSGRISAEGNIYTESWIVANNMGVDAYDLNVAGSASLGNIGNITINGGSNGYAIITDGAGGLSFSPVVTGTGNITFDGSSIETTSNTISLVANGTAWSFNSNGVTNTPVGTDPNGVSSQQYVNGTVTTVEGDVNASTVGNANGTIWTAEGANIVGGSMRLCVQSYDSGNINYNVEMMEISFAKEWNNSANAFYVVSDRVQTNSTAVPASVSVALTGANALCVIASVNDANTHYYTYSVTAFDNTPN